MSFQSNLRKLRPKGDKFLQVYQSKNCNINTNVSGNCFKIHDQPSEQTSCFDEGQSRVEPNQ